MIAVTLRQEPVVFKVRIGEKVVGKVIGYRHGSKIWAKYWDETCEEYHGFDNYFANMRAATKAILRKKGYLSYSGGDLGKIAVRRITGIR